MQKQPPHASTLIQTRSISTPVLISACCIASLLLFSSARLGATTVDARHLQGAVLPTCNTPSERLEQQGDSYYDIETPREHKRRDIAALDKFYDALRGSWKGSMVDSVCLGNRETLRVEQQLYDIEWLDSEITYKGHLRMRMERVRLETRQGKTRAVSLTQSKDDFLKADDLLSIEQVDSHTFKLNRRYRQAQNNPLFRSTGSSLATTNTYLRERNDTLTLKGKSLEIKTDWYTNGMYAGTEIKRLRKR